MLRERRVQVGQFDGMALAIFDIQVVPADALHLRTVEILCRREAQLPTGRNECC